MRGREKGGAREGERTCEGGREEVRGREKGGCRGLASGASLVDDAIECKTRKKKSHQAFSRTCSSLYTFSYAEVQSSNAERGLPCRASGWILKGVGAGE